MHAFRAIMTTDTRPKEARVGFSLAGETLTVGAMAWRARAERRYARLIAGVCAAAAMLAGRFLFDSRLLAYAGGAALLAAALWRRWPRPNDCPRQGECR